MSKVEFAPWETPFKNAELLVLDLRFQTGHGAHENETEDIGIDSPEENGREEPELIVRLLHCEDDAVYSLVFHGVGAFRLLDEHGLLELWQETSNLGGRPAQSTFRVRNHLWSKESHLSFFSFATDDWSFVIATDWECVEVVCGDRYI